MSIDQFYGQSASFFQEKNCGHTAAEIAHQPAMWRALDTYLNDNMEAIAKFWRSIPSVKDLRIILTGAGSSGFVGRIAAGFASEGRSRICEAIHTTDLVSAPKLHLMSDRPTLLISFARSGNSPESVAAVEYARKIIKDLYEVAIVCDGESKLANITRASKKSLVLVMPEGTNDKGFAMTSSVSSMILAADAFFNPFSVLQTTISALAQEMEHRGAAYAKLAEECASWGFDRAWHMGSGAMEGLAQEGALKMMELTNGAVVAGSNNSLEFRHGPKTVMTPKTLTVHLIATRNHTRKYDLDLFNELCSQRTTNKIVAIHPNDDTKAADLTVPYTPFSPLASAMQGLVFLQLLALYTSIAHGVPTDNPSPSGLVNRVVQGVTIYPIKELSEV